MEILLILALVLPLLALPIALGMRRHPAALIPPLIFVGYLKAEQPRTSGMNMLDPTLICLGLLAACIALNVVVSFSKHEHGLKILATYWKGIVSFSLLVGAVAVSYLYTASPAYGLEKLSKFVVISGILFLAPLLLVRSESDLSDFTVSMQLLAAVLSIRLLFGVTAPPVTSSLTPDRDVTQIGSGQMIGMSLLWTLFYSRKRYPQLSMLLLVPLFCAALIGSVARGPLLSFIFVFAVCMLSRRLRSCVMSGKLWIPLVISVLLAIGASIYLLQQNSSSQAKLQTKVSELGEIFSGSLTPSYTAGRRLMLYRWAWGMFEQKPITGWGVGGWSYYAFDMDFPAYPHNILLEFAAEQGLMGLSLLFLLLTYMVISLRRMWRTKSEFSFVAPVFGFSIAVAMFSGDINVNRPLWLWCGLITVLSGMAITRQPVMLIKAVHTSELLPFALPQIRS